MTLCQCCDCYVGVAGAAVFMQPEGYDHAWLASHCWGCGRSEAEVRHSPRSRPAAPFQPYRIMPSAWPEHVRDDAPSNRCSACGRNTWSVEAFGNVCGMTQPNGQACAGRFEP